MTFAPGEVVRCVGNASSGRPCRKAFALAKVVTMVTLDGEAGFCEGAQLLHRCASCKSMLAVTISALVAAYG